MTREEIDFIGSMNMCDEISNDAYKKILCHCEEQEPCEDVPDTNVGDIISRQAAIDALSHMCSEDENGITVSRANVNSMLRVLSPVTPHPKTGHWIRMKAYEKWGCSECHTIFRFTFKEHDYCPNCGAKMESEE